MRNNKQRGFTLIELMVTLAVAAILITVGLPSFANFIKRSQITEQRDSLYSSLMLARSEAVNRGHSMSVCVSANQSSCNAIGAGTVSWAPGWLVFTDPDEDGLVDADETVLKVMAAIDGGNSLEWGDGRRITFDNEGSSNSVGTFTFCDSSDDVQFARAIIISSSGRIRRDITNDSGGALVCN